MVLDVFQRPTTESKVQTGVILVALFIPEYREVPCGATSYVWKSRWSGSVRRWLKGVTEMMIVLTKVEFGCRGEDADVKFPYLVLNVIQR